MIDITYASSVSFFSSFFLMNGIKCMLKKNRYQLTQFMIAMWEKIIYAYKMADRGFEDVRIFTF